MIVFVVLHYQVYEETQKCVDSLLKLAGKKKIVIVDNGSTNMSGDNLKKNYEDNHDVHVIIMEENLGFACGNNVGYKYAIETYNPDFLIVMNNDMEIEYVDFIDGIYRCYKEYGFDIMAPDVYSTKKNMHQNPEKDLGYNIETLKKIRSEIQFKLRFKFLFKLKGYIKKKTSNEQIKQSIFDDSIRINVPLHGSFYVFSKEFLKNHSECFYNKTFMYMESQILYHQAMKTGLKMVYDPRLQVLHHEDVATNDTYETQYKKAVFTNRCLLKSCDAFIELLESELEDEQQ